MKSAKKTERQAMVEDRNTQSMGIGTDVIAAWAIVAGLFVAMLILSLV